MRPGLVAHIAAAAALSLPHHLHASTNLAFQFECAVAELRAVGTALQQYKLDHGGQMPPRLTNLVSEAYLPAGGLVSCADPFAGTEGGVPNSYTDLSQCQETDEGGSSYLYEFSEAECLWSFWSSYLGGTPNLTDVDVNLDGTASWAEVKQWQMDHGDKTQQPANRPYARRKFPVVRCFWFQYPDAWPNAIDPTVLNLAADLQTVFASPPQWELDQFEQTPLERVALQMESVGTALQQYKLDHGGQMPPRLTNLVSEAYLPAGGLVSCADPFAGTEGGVPNSYTDLSQCQETDEGGSSYLYEFSEAACTSWNWETYLCGDPSVPALDTDNDGKVSWAEAKQWQSVHGDMFQQPTNGPYSSQSLPVVRCFWPRFPEAGPGTVSPTVLNLAADLQTIFASGPTWEVSATSLCHADPPDLRDLRRTKPPQEGIELALATVDEALELPLWPKATELTNLTCRLLVPVAKGQDQAYGQIAGNVFRWRPRPYSPSYVFASVGLACGGTVVTQKYYAVSVDGTDSLKIDAIFSRTNPVAVVIEWNSITGTLYHVDEAMNPSCAWVSNVYAVAGDGTRKHYTNEVSIVPARVFRLRAEFNDQ